jgi:hypothetical protein
MLSKSKKITNKERKLLEKEIPKLSKNEHNELFNIIRNNNSKYSENARGVYINVKYLDKNTIDKIIEFIEYTKKNKKILKDNSLVNNNNNNSEDKYEKVLLDKKTIHKELERLKGKKNDNFSFQNFLDKLSITNIKQFQQQDEKIIYPDLKNSNIKFNGVKARLLKKCRDANRYTSEISFNNQDVNSNDDDSINLKSKLNLNKDDVSYIEDDIFEDESDEEYDD